MAKTTLKSLLEGYAWERNERSFGKALPTLEDVQVSPSNVVELTFNYEAYGSDTNMFQNVEFPDAGTEAGFYPFE